VLFDNETFKEDMKEGIYIFEKDGVPVGYAMIKYKTRKFAEISNLWLRREFRSKGISNEMLRMIIAELRSMNLCAVVTLKNDNFGLIRLFEQENFELKAIMSREKL
jgi:ribosomal protein S18 acetylase RimI-like enzyme